MDSVYRRGPLKLATGSSDKQSASDNNLLVAMKYEVWAKSLVAVVGAHARRGAPQPR